MAPSLSNANQPLGWKGAALVTGATEGLGGAIALRLADDGFDIAINSHSSSKGELEGRRTLVIFYRKQMSSIWSSLQFGT